MNRRDILTGMFLTLAVGGSVKALLTSGQEPEAAPTPTPTATPSSTTPVPGDTLVAQDVHHDIQVEIKSDRAMNAARNIYPEAQKIVSEHPGKDETVKVAKQEEPYLPESSAKQNLAVEQSAAADAAPSEEVEADEAETIVATPTPPVVEVKPVVTVQTLTPEVPTVAIQTRIPEALVPLAQNPVVQPIPAITAKPVIDALPDLADVPLPVRRPNFKVADIFKPQKSKPVPTTTKAKPVPATRDVADAPEQPKKFELFRPWINRNPTKAVAFYNPHHEEWLKIDLKNPDWSEVNKFARDPWNKVFPIEKSLITSRIAGVYNSLVSGGATIKSITAFSVFRSPEYNEWLRHQKGHGGQAKGSVHRIGEAIDSEFNGVGLATLKKVAEQEAAAAGRGGTGYYPGSFVHMDVARKREWNG